MSEHKEHHITPISTLVGVFLALVVLMTLTVVSSKLDLTPIGNNAANLGIAVIKATLVVSFFMGLKYSSKLAKLFGLAGFVWLVLMTIIFGDYMTRKWEPVHGWYAKDSGNDPAPTEQMRTVADPKAEPTPEAIPNGE
jgi:cytochrome c oxidase subunit 4